MRHKKGLIVLLNLLLVLGLFNWSVAKKEKTLKKGKLILLELAPVDPRSLMQGDYMNLNYAITQRSRDSQLQRIRELLNQDNLPSRGYCVVSLNEHQVAQLVRFQPTTANLQQGEHLVKYFKPDWQMNIGAESFFFEEGQAALYEQAKYGGLKVDEAGNSILIGLYDKNYRLLRPEKKEH